jgi:hypothetical protein
VTGPQVWGAGYSTNERFLYHTSSADVNAVFEESLDR